MKASIFISWTLLIPGTLVYVVGLWRACPLLNGKGYFLGILISGMFITYAYLRAEKRGYLDANFTSVCQVVMLITVGLLFVGVANAPLLTIEKGLYPAAFFASLFGQMLLARSSDNAKSAGEEKKLSDRNDE